MDRALHRLHAGHVHPNVRIALLRALESIADAALYERLVIFCHRSTFLEKPCPAQCALLNLVLAAGSRLTHELFDTLEVLIALPPFFALPRIVRAHVLDTIRDHPGERPLYTVLL